MQAAAIGQNKKAFRWHHLERLSNALGNQFRRFNRLRLHVDHANSKFESRGQLAKKLQVLASAPCKFQRELVDLRIQNPGE